MDHPFISQTRPYKGLSQLRGDELPPPPPVWTVNCGQRDLSAHPPGSQLQAGARWKLSPSLQDTAVSHFRILPWVTCFHLNSPLSLGAVEGEQSIRYLMTSCPHVPSRHLTGQLSLLVRACSGLRLWLGLVDLYPTHTPHLAGLGSSKTLQAQGYSRARLNREGPIPSPALYGAWTAFTQHLAKRPRSMYS